jgi:hypothetical protein
MITDEARRLVALVPLNGISLTVVLFLSMFHASRGDFLCANDLIPPLPDKDK